MLYYGNLDIYLTILHEVKDFPQNIKTIAENIGNVKEKMNILERNMETYMDTRIGRNIHSCAHLDTSFLSAWPEVRI